MTATTTATITSTLGGTVTLPSGGGTETLTADTPLAVPAGSTISFTGSSTGTIQITGAGTLALSGAGTLSLANAAAASTAGTITSSGGITSFSSGITTSSLPSGTQISLTGSGSLAFSSTTTDSLQVIVPASSSFTTTGSELATTGYNVPTSWSNISALSQSTGNGATTVTITQDAQQALLNWTTFNVGKNTILDFDQSAGGTSVGDWVAINRILDPSLAPSQILGSIEAPGQVYVINQNGIVFNGSSQINTHALVASTLPINSNLVASGLLENPYAQYLFSSIDEPSYEGSTEYNPATDPNVLPNVTSGDIAVQQGAEITSPTNAEHVGGKIALIGSNVDNEGLLSSPDGQVILAAGQQVGFSAHPSSDPSLRGLDVAIGQDPGTVSNGVDGYIYTPRADVTMAGGTVNQLGYIESTTSVSLNGRVDLLAESGMSPVADLTADDYVLGNPTDGGTVTLGANSVTEILPEYDSTDTITGTSLALPSQIYIAGDIFHMAANAELVAPNATATISMGILNAPIASATGETTAPLAVDEAVQEPLTYLSGGQVYLDAGATIDVSGSSDVNASVLENIIAVQLRGAELENSPLQQNGALRGQTVVVDMSQTGTYDGTTWVGSPIGDLSGYEGLIERNVGELTVDGGSVAIDTDGSVVMQPTSEINVSGGSIDYQGATVATTKVITATGEVIDISQATPDQVYEGIYTGDTVTSAKYDTTENFQSSLETGAYYDAGYVQGGAGGSLAINTPAAALDGSFYGNTVTGARQQLTPPTTSTLDLAIQEYVTTGPVNIIFQSGSSGQQAVDAFVDGSNQAVTLSSDRASNIYLSPDLVGTDGFGDVTVSTPNGDVTVATNTNLDGLAGGSISLSGANLDIEGQIYVPGGALALTTYAIDPFGLFGSQSYDPTRGNAEIFSGAELSTVGVTFDQLTGGISSGTLPFDVNGGSIRVNASNLEVDAGSTVDASGGAARNLAGKISYGKGGSISLTGYYEDTDGSVDGGVILNGDLEAYGTSAGGSLSITAPAVQVGGGSENFSGGGTLLALPDKFFSQGGFSSFSLDGHEGVNISGTINPVPVEEQVTTSLGSSWWA